MRKIKLLYLLPIAAMVFVGCDKKNKKNNEPEQQQPSGDQGGGGDQTPAAKNFEGLSLANLTVDYDGQPHSIAVSGELPEGAVVTYGENGNTFTAPGTYQITATVSKEGYNNLELSATLTINKLTFQGIVFEGVEVPYDGQPHSIEPVVPAEYEGCQISYDDNGNSFTGAGLHVVTATVSKENYNDWVGTANVNIGPGPQATEALTVMDFEGKTDNDLGDDFELKFYHYTDGWITPSSAKLTIEKNQVFGTGTNTMKFSVTHQGGAPFKATTQLKNKEYKKYTGFSIDAMMDSRAPSGTVKLQVQLWLKDLPLPDAYAGYRDTYVTYTVSEAAPSIWTHFEVPFTDSSLSIAGGAIPVSALAGLGVTMEDVSAYIDKVAVLVYPSSANYESCYAYVDNIKLTRGVDRAEEKFIYGGSYGYKSPTDHLYTLDMDAALENGTFKTDGVVQSQLLVEKGPTAVTFKDATYNGAGLTVNASITDKGTLLVTSVSGAAEEQYQYLENLEFAKVANLDYNLTDKSSQAGGQLVDSNWKQEKYTDSWVAVSGQMNCRSSGGNYFANMTTGYSTAYRYTYTNAVAFGLANTFSIDLGNDYSGCTDIQIKIRLVKENGQDLYVLGDANNWAVIAANTAKFQNYKFNEFGEFVFKAIVITIKSAKNGSDYLYFDNMKLSYDVEQYNNKYYLWNGSEDAFRIDVSESFESARLYKLGVAGEMLFDVEQEGLTVTFKDHDTEGAGLTIGGTVDAGTGVITINSVEGQAAALYSASFNGKSVKPCADVALDFSDGTLDATYTEAHWKESKYQSSAWTDYATPTDMRSKADKNSNKVVNFHCGTGAKNFRYSPDLPIGPVNHMEVDLGNYWNSSAGTLKYKIALLKNDGSTVEKYIAGDASTWATLAKDTSNGSQLTHFSFDFNLGVGYQLRITTSMDSGEAYLYMDNLSIFYKA